MFFETEVFETVPGNPNWGGPVTDADSDDNHPEDNLTLPWTIDPATSWADFNCWVEVELDAGMALHKILPQVNPAIDTLSSINIDDAAFASAVGNVNIKSNSLAVDFIQRMASSTYRFYLRGWAFRVGYQIPIPGLKTVAGLKAIPEGKQRAANIKWSSLPGGIPYWMAYWDLSYVLVQSPQRNEAPQVPNPAEALPARPTLPNAVLLPRTPLDQHARQNMAPTVNLGFIVRRE